MNVLIVSPAFAPYSGVGANRMVSLANYLITQNVNTTVVRNMATVDIAMYTAEEPKGIQYVDINIQNDFNFSEMQEKYINVLITILRNENIDCVVFSVGPYYTYKSIIDIRATYNIPIILDFRDLFVYECRRHDGINNEIRRFIYHKRYSRLEKKAVAASSMIVTVTPSDLAVMRKKYRLSVNKSFLITNGYDEARINNITQKTEIPSFIEDDYFNIGVFGKLSTYNKKLTDYVFKAIQCLNNNGYKVRIVQIGAEEKYISTLLENKDIDSNYYSYMGNVEYSKGINLLRSVNALTFVYSSKTGYGTKLFDYIYLNKPIILMTIHNTEIANIVNSFENGHVCFSSKQYEKTIKQIMDKNENNLTNKKTADFSREKQNVLFYELIRKVVNGV